LQQSNYDSPTATEEPAQESEAPAAA
jgi:hypothetical protein